MTNLWESNESESDKIVAADPLELDEVLDAWAGACRNSDADQQECQEKPDHSDPRVIFGSEVVGERQAGQHEDDGAARGELGEEVACAATSEDGVAAPAAESSAHVRSLSALQQHHEDEREAGEDVECDEKG